MSTRDDALGAALESGRIGNYRILRKLAEGGMGVVYVAEQDSPRRVVALKVVRPGLATDELLQRFEHESQILAHLSHPGIAQVFEAGWAETSAGSLPFFAMELVRGEPLTAWAKANRVDAAGCLEIFVKVCDAVHHAHMKGVIHRDLKPANILVESSGQPKVLDFGIARATNSDLAVVTLRTDVGQILGTLSYMSPEQVAADPYDLDVRSDVYSLGVILHELLTGDLPYDLSKKMLHEAVQIIREVEPTRLGTRSRSLRGDLETIVAKALAKAKTRRYASAADLAEDVQRHLRHEPIVARPPSAVYQLAKFARRHRALVAGALAFLLALVAGAATSTVMALRARAAERLARERSTEADEARALAEEREKRADSEARKALAVSGFLRDILEQANPMFGQAPDLTVREVLDGAAAELEEGELAEDDEVELAVRSTLGASYASLGVYDRAEPHLVRALELARAQHDADAPENRREIGDAERELAILWGATDRCAQAEPAARRALAIHRELDGDDSEAVAEDELALAEILHVLGRRPEAFELCRSALDKRRKLHGERSVEAARAMQVLVMFLNGERDYSEAETLLGRIREIYTEEYGPEHPLVAAAALDLGRILQVLGRDAAAETLLVEALELIRKAYGPDHPRVADALFSVGDAYAGRRETERGLALVREALAIREKRLGDHRDTATALQGVASILLKTGAREESERLTRQALAMRIRVFGPRGVAVADSLLNLGDLLLESGESAAAVQALEEALRIWLDAFGPRHYDVGHAHLRLARALRANGSFGPAAENARAAFEIFDALPELGEGLAGDARILLAEILLQASQWTEAEVFLRELLARYATTFGTRHSMIAYTRIQLGAALAGQQRFDEAEPLMLDNWPTIEGDATLWRATKRDCCAWIADLYRAWARPEDAATWEELQKSYE